MPFLPLHFSNGYQLFLFFFLFSSYSSFPHFLSNYPTSFRSLQSFCLSLLFLHPLINLKSIFLKILSSSPMAPKTKKSSYMITVDNFNLTRWIGAIRLNESPPLLYRSMEHLLDNAWLGLVSFPNFSHF